MYGGMVRSRGLVVAVAFSAAACLFPDLSALNGSDAGAGDSGDAAFDAPSADASDASDAGKSCDLSKQFTPRKLNDIANGNSQFNPTLTADELEMWWGEFVPAGDAGGGVAHVMHAKRSSIGSPFGPASIESGIDNGEPVDPNLSDDGLALVYAKGGSIGGLDLFKATRPKLGDPFGTGIQLPSGLQSTGDEISPFLTTDGSLYFPSNRSGWGIYFVQSLGNNAWSAPVRVPALSSTAGEDGLALSHDGL